MTGGPRHSEDQTLLRLAVVENAYRREAAGDDVDWDTIIDEYGVGGGDADETASADVLVQ